MKERPFYVPIPDRKGLTGKITWSGTSFKYDPLPGSIDTLSGRVGYNNGILLRSLDYLNANVADRLQMSVRNLPCDTKVFMDPKNVNIPVLMSCKSGDPVIQPYITLLSWSSHEEQTVPGNTAGSEVKETWDAKLTAIDWTKGGDLCITFSP